VTRLRAGRADGAAGGAAPGPAPAPAPAGPAPAREAPAAVAHALARLLPALAGLDLPCFLHMLGSRRARWTRPRPALKPAPDLCCAGGPGPAPPPACAGQQGRGGGPYGRKLVALAAGGVRDAAPNRGCSARTQAALLPQQMHRERWCTVFIMCMDGRPLS